jgi:hypothetical protein
VTNESDRLATLSSWLGTVVGEAYSAALAIDQPCGTSPEWLALLARYRIAAVDSDGRQRAALASRVLRGAPADELYAVLVAIAAAGRTALGDWNFESPEIERSHERLRRKLDGLANETIAHYRRTVMPAPSMFAGALASVAARGGGKADTRKSQPHILRCRRCGGPRLTTTDLTCVYCDATFGQDG